MNPPTPPRRSGRGPRAEGDSRADILDAARALFAAKGFRSTTTREIAARAGVDAALIHHFFGTKAELFETTVQIPRIAAELAARLGSTEGDPAEAITRLYLEQFFTRDVATFSALLRTALSSPGEFPQVVRRFEETVVGAATRSLRGPDAALRAEIVGAQMIGILVMRHLVGIEPIASASVDDLVRRLVPAIHALIDTDEE